jgi:hypothetical protein
MYKEAEEGEPSPREDEEDEEEPITPPPTPIKAKGSKRKAVSSTTAKAAKKPRAKATTTTTSHRGWEPAQDALLLRLKKEGKKWGEISVSLKEIFNIDKKPDAIRMHFRDIQANNFEWTAELVCNHHCEESMDRWRLTVNRRKNSLPRFKNFSCQRAIST